MSEDWNRTSPNIDRANRGFEMADLVREQTDPDEHSAAGFLSRAISDLLHYAAESGLDIHDEIDEALTLYNAEKAG